MISELYRETDRNKVNNIISQYKKRCGDYDTYNEIPTGCYIPRERLNKLEKTIENYIPNPDYFPLDEKDELEEIIDNYDDDLQSSQDCYDLREEAQKYHRDENDPYLSDEQRYAIRRHKERIEKIGEHVNNCLVFLPKKEEAIELLEKYKRKYMDFEYVQRERDILLISDIKEREEYERFLEKEKRKREKEEEELKEKELKKSAKKEKQKKKKEAKLEKQLEKERKEREEEEEEEFIKETLEEQERLKKEQEEKDKQKRQNVSKMLIKYLRETCFTKREIGNFIYNSSFYHPSLINLNVVNGKDVVLYKDADNKLKSTSVEEYYKFIVSPKQAENKIRELSHFIDSFVNLIANFYDKENFLNEQLEILAKYLDTYDPVKFKEDLDRLEVYMKNSKIYSSSYIKLMLATGTNDYYAIIALGNKILEGKEIKISDLCELFSQQIIWDFSLKFLREKNSNESLIDFYTLLSSMFQGAIYPMMTVYLVENVK